MDYNWERADTEKDVINLDNIFGGNNCSFSKLVVVYWACEAKLLLLAG